MLSRFIEWLESHLLTCSYKKYLGVECPGCGMQRAFVEMLKGNFYESIVLYPALPTTLFLLLFLVLHLIFKFKYGANILKYTFILNAVIMVLNYIYKLLTL